MSIYRSLLRPLLFRLSPDRSHQIGRSVLRWAPPWRALSVLSGLSRTDPVLRTTFAGMTLDSPVGLAAGFDKDGELVEALSCLGFGFVSVGSIMPEPRFGNPFPRLVRWEEREALIDSMGVPSRGCSYAVQQLRSRHAGRVPVFANVGGFSAETIADSVLAVQPYVDGVEISLMCPNVLAAGERFDELAMLRGVLARVEQGRQSLVVRVPNDTTSAHDRFAELVEICVEAGVGGLKVGGGYAVAEKRLGSGRGTVHGRIIFERALENVERAAGFAKGRIAIKGNGGISSAADVLAMRRAGAVCVDLYSAFIYRGWTIARDINRDLAHALSSNSDDRSSSAAPSAMETIASAAK
jgi:dihydroorotate dehydrogenase (fumarate)/dihydroorotate dehydrogenase